MNTSIALPRWIRLLRRFARMRSHLREWEYGTCKDRRARRNRRTGAVQFVLWDAGEQGHRNDYWHNFDSYWWDLFLPNLR